MKRKNSNNVLNTSDPKKSPEVSDNHEKVHHHQNYLSPLSPRTQEILDEYSDYGRRYSAPDTEYSKIKSSNNSPTNRKSSWQDNNGDYAKPGFFKSIKSKINLIRKKDGEDSGSTNTKEELSTKDLKNSAMDLRVSTSNDFSDGSDISSAITESIISSKDIITNDYYTITVTKITTSLKKDKTVIKKTKKFNVDDKYTLVVKTNKLQKDLKSHLDDQEKAINDNGEEVIIRTIKMTFIDVPSQEFETIFYSYKHNKGIDVMVNGKVENINIFTSPPASPMLTSPNVVHKIIHEINETEETVLSGHINDKLTENV